MSAERAERADVPAAVELADVVAAEVAEAVAVAHRVAVLAETDPGAPLVVATRAALEVADARRTARRNRRVAGWEVHGGDGAWWARWAAQWIPAAELADRRATPGPVTFEDGASGAEPAAMARTSNEPDGARGRRAETVGGIAYGADQKDGE